MLTKTCSKCKDDKPRNEFSKHPKGKFGLHPRCNPCRSTAAKTYYRNRTKARSWNKKSWLKMRYGLAIETYEQMKRDQNNLCAICGQPPTKRELHVDHCHVTGVVRGLLCWKCNAGLGSFNEDQDRMARAIAYLNKWRKAVDLNHTPVKEPSV